MMPATADLGTVAQLLVERANATPHAVAFHREATDGNWLAITWMDFLAQVKGVRLALVASGLRRGDRLALIAPVSVEWELLHHAALGLGVVVVGLDAHDMPARVARMIEQAQVSAIASSDAKVLSALAVSQFSSCKLLLCMGPVRPADMVGPAWLDWNGFLANARPTDNPLPVAAATDTATIIFTSGTTGAPRGIAYSHAQVCLAVAAICDAFAFVGTRSRLLCWLPLSNLFQRMVNLAAIQQGAATYLLGDPRRVMDVVAAVSPDVFVAVPRFFEKLHDGLLASQARMPFLQRQLLAWAWSMGRRVRTAERAGQPVPAVVTLAHRLADRWVLSRVRAAMGERLQCMVSGSAPIPRHLLEEFHALGWLVLEAYGLSENILPMAMNRIGQVRFGTVGRPVPGNEIRIDENGTIRVRGPGVFQGYLGLSASAVLDSEGFFATGDLGVFDSDNYLSLTGRNGDLIKTSTGRRVAPAGVEAALRSVSGVDHAMLAGAGRKCLVALCACSADLRDANALRQLKVGLREQVTTLSAHEQPLALALIQRPFGIESGELTPNLKLRRDAITDRYAALLDDLYRAVDAGNGSPPAIIVVH